jgi:hypothetical protein
MFSSILTNILFSFVIIIGVHYLFNYLKDNFTVKKTKDILGSHIEKYKTIIEDLEKKHNCERVEEEIITNSEKELLEDDLDQYIASLNSEISTEINL